MTIQLVNAVRVDGDSQSAGAQLTLSAALEAELVALLVPAEVVAVTVQDNVPVPTSAATIA